jgi:hypothetical protein
MARSLEVNVAGELQLEVRDYSDTRWRWVLTDSGGSIIGDYEVRLKVTDWQFDAFADLPGHLFSHVTPDRQREHERVAEVGEWIGANVFGPIATTLLENAPATVTVTVPDNARDLLLRPLQLAHCRGKPLSVQDVTLVMRLASDDGCLKPAGKRLRVLGLFSLPDGSQSLNLRRERHELVRLIERMRVAGKAVDVRVLQYGVTRQRLQEVLREPEGWDIVHISGHARPGELLLETAAGTPDRINAAALADLLELARGRVKLATLSACWSAAGQHMSLGLPRTASAAEAERVHLLEPSASSSSVLATDLARRLNCAVLAMRYPVEDNFASALSQTLYALLLDKSQPLPLALALALREVSDTGTFSPLSAATPALFGGQSAILTLAAPTRPDPGDNRVAHPKLDGFPPQPERFVGRTRVMAEASEALAAQSGIPGVLLHGMPGGGKTACALELAYTHEHAFDRFVWFKAPDEGAAMEDAVTEFALRLEAAVPGLQMAHLTRNKSMLMPFLPTLTERMQRERLLVVIDNAESLSDDRWDLVISALTTHKGLGRIIVTTRRAPGSASAMRVESVDTLSQGETSLLVRELPGLTALMDGTTPGIKPHEARRLGRRTLEASRGHPKLLEFAEGQAASPDLLSKLIGTDSLIDADYTKTLAAWTRAVTQTLTPSDRDLFWFLCCLEESDRERAILNDNWADLRQRLGGAGHPPDIGQALSTLTIRGLVSHDRERETYEIHPEVALVGRTSASKFFRDAVDEEITAWWAHMYVQAFGSTSEEGGDTGLLVRAGLATVTYLVRQQRWDDAGSMLEGAFMADASRVLAAAVFPIIKQIASHDPTWSGLLAKILSRIDSSVGEDQLRADLDGALAADNYARASSAAERLGSFYLNSGRLDDARRIFKKKAAYTRKAGFGPWSQLGDKAGLLQVEVKAGRYRYVLDQVKGLLGQMEGLPTVVNPLGEERDPASTRELVYDAGREAAMRLGEWNDALSLSAAMIASMRDRNEPATAVARARFNDYGPLLRTRRTDEAFEILLECLHVFKEANDIAGIGNTCSALAQVENERRHGDVAIQMQRDALRYKYVAGDVFSIAISYHNLGDYLILYTRQPVPALACHLTAALIDALTGNSSSASVDAAAMNIYLFGGAAAPPANVAELHRNIGEIPGADLAGLIAQLSPSSEAAELALRNIIAQAKELSDGV